MAIFPVATIFVDCDETLVKTTPLQPGQKFPKEAQEVFFMGRRCASTVRPSALPFLKAVSQMCNANVHILTFGHPELQDQVLKAHGLRQHIREIFGEHDPKPLCAGSWVLIDDLPLFSAGLEFKLRRLGIDRLQFTRRAWRTMGKLHVVHCKPFLGSNDESPLTQLLMLIEKKLAMQTLPTA